MSSNANIVSQRFQNECSVTTSFLIDRINAMKRQEMAFYLYHMYLQPSRTRQCEDDRLEFYAWREKICHWSYSVIDHFDLSRHTVAISLDLFDRFLATKGNKCKGSCALLISLTTLYIAVKINESKKIKLSTLTHLSRGQFDSQDIEKMEVKILKALSWLVHPPTVVDFIHQILKLLPVQIRQPVRYKIFELSRYTAELSVCDPFFIEYPPSMIAFAAILNVLKYEIDFDSCPAHYRDRFLSDLYENLNFHRDCTAVKDARDRLQKTLTASGMMYGANGVNDPHVTRQEERNLDEPVRLDSSYDSIDLKGSLKPFTRDESIDSKGSRSLSRNRRLWSPRSTSLVNPR